MYLYVLLICSGLLDRWNHILRIREARGLFRFPISQPALLNHLWYVLETQTTKIVGHLVGQQKARHSQSNTWPIIHPASQGFDCQYEPVIHPRKLTCPQKRDYLNRKYSFQPLIFRGHVSFPGEYMLNHFNSLSFEFWWLRIIPFAKRISLPFAIRKHVPSNYPVSGGLNNANIYPNFEGFCLKIAWFRLA